MTLVAVWPELDGFYEGTLAEANSLLAQFHYLGPARSARLVVCQWSDGGLVGAMVWRHPTARHLPADGTWLELSRWCLTPSGGPNAGSRMHRAAVAMIRVKLPDVTTLVSYSDRAAGHTGSLYRACNWRWKPTWHRLKPPPTGGGSWDGVTRQEPKDRWVFFVRPDSRRDDILAVKA